MKKMAYHHGNLRCALIETGIELINQDGEENLSLRKVAKKCGVSNAAPYAHFKNKDEFIGAIQQYIMDLFSETLLKTIQQYADTTDLLIELGKSYVMFFYENPLYFNFIFSRKNITINLSINNTNEDKNEPLEILKKVSMQVFKQSNLSSKIIEDKIIAMWALVQGLSSIIAMPNVKLEGNIEKRIDDIIRSISIPYRKEDK